MNKSKKLTTVEEIKAFTDPYRIRILSVYKKFGRPATVKEVADEMGEVPAKVHYHVKKLESSGILELIYTKEINGIVAKYYEPTAKSFKIESETLNPAIKSLLLNETKKAINSVYEESERIVLESLDNPDDDEEVKNASIQSSTLYLSKDEAEHIQNSIKEVLRAHEKNKKEEKDKNPYHFFNVFFPDRKSVV